ncbi:MULTISPECIES: ATP-binding protein [Streptomyces]|uniref:ATP-binding protein n=1 Tax=Streptomyces TaxID=1883 RepID=UPI001E598C19|nr:MULTISPECIES: ATP-binding protein [Streptomyces]MCZ4098519.1 ATP-binding protein [Streptomyces sp. H39-C1]
MGETSLKATGWARSFPVTAGVRASRRWTREHLDSLEWTSEVPETVDAILLTVSELVTNAHIHAHSSARLVLTWDSRCLQVSVSDSSDHLPAPRAPDEERPSGRGLAIVEALADEWETHARSHGKTVSACFHPPGRPDPRTVEAHPRAASSAEGWRVPDRSSLPGHSVAGPRRRR